jgi:FkbM family methyltransferase
MENYSQFGQDIHIINNIFDKKENGYFVDIGAYDGINMSNTYLLEKNYGWKGISVEANPRYFNKLQEIRKSININKAIYKNDDEEFDFIDDFNGGCSGLQVTNSHNFLNDCPIIKVKTKNLTTLLEEHNAPNFIEYLSIDTEGSEFDILNSHNFDKYKFGYITVEHNFIVDNRMKIRNLLYNKGYIFYRENGVDDDYILKLKGIFYNSKQSLCSIYESGKMAYNCLKKSNFYTLDYTEEREFLYNYDFVIVNEHFIVNNWVTEQMVKIFNKPVFCLVTEVSFTENYIDKSPRFYTAYIVLDPSINEHNNIYGFPRPLEDYIIPTFIENSIPIIGSFGFATNGKNWHKIVEETQKDFEEAIIRFNIPLGTYLPNNQANINDIITQCNNVLTNPNIKLEITHNNYTKEELINWCAQNTINCFLYEREQIGFNNGLCATTDQSIVSEKPLLVSKDNTFRHIHKYIDFYPNISIKQAIEQTQNGVKKMKNDWSSNKFLNKFNDVLFKHLFLKNDNIQISKLNEENILFGCKMSAYYHINNYTESGNVTSKVYELFSNLIDKKQDNFIVSNIIFSDTYLNHVKTLFINLTKNDKTITISNVEHSTVSWNDIIIEINKLLDNQPSNANQIEVSIGEIIDKYSILELKKKYITNKNKLEEIQKEIEVLSHFIKNIDHFFYSLILYINEQIWLDTDVIKSLSLNNNIYLFAEISNRIFENNQKRFRLKNYFNVLQKSNIKEQKSYNDNKCFIEISNDEEIYNKIPEINYLCISYDIIYINVEYKSIFNKLFKNPNIIFANDFRISDNTIQIIISSYIIDSSIRYKFDFPTLKYKSSGKLGDFLNQLSVVCEKFYETGRKAELYIFNLDCQGDRFPYGLEYTYTDTYNSIVSQIFIKDYKIYNNEIVDFDLSSWRSNFVLDNWYNIYKKKYNVDWGKHKWLTGDYDPKWSNKIIINITPYRFLSSNALLKLSKIIKIELDNCIFISNEKEHYDHFSKEMNLNITYYQPSNFDEVVTIINSCKMAYLGFSGNAVISNSLHKNHTIIGKDGGDYILNNLKGIIPHVIDVLI